MARASDFELVKNNVRLDYEPGLAYWFVVNGVRLTSMPSFKHTLSDAEMWQVSLLLKNANQTMPAPLTQILNAPKP
ncbi:MAG TPA: cytochrome c [Edaphobacter sp.]|nr:cytochrome c [Edaphobacter sp.]